MKIVIKKGRHYPWLIPIGLPIWVRKNTSTFRSADFMFTNSCMFDLHDEDQWDVNKLFGFSIGHHQNCNSFRFGWRPVLKNNTIEIVAYEYHNGFRIKTKPLCEVELNRWHEFIISYNPQKGKTYYFVDKKSYSFDTGNLTKKYGLGYTLGVYFGGNEKAPKNITIFKRK
jgi:hypothetical protein